MQNSVAALWIGFMQYLCLTKPERQTNSWISDNIPDDSTTENSCPLSLSSLLPPSGREGERKYGGWSEVWQNYDGLWEGPEQCLQHHLRECQRCGMWLPLEELSAEESEWRWPAWALK